MKETVKSLNEVNLTGQRGKVCIMMIATGANHVLALDTAGNVYAWGSNKSGQLGITGSKANHSRARGGNVSQSQGRSGFDEESKAGGDHHIPFLAEPTLVEGGIKDYEICQIYAGRAQSFAVTRTGKIFAWGDNTGNILGLELNFNPR